MNTEQSSVRSRVVGVKLGGGFCPLGENDRTRIYSHPVELNNIRPTSEFLEIQYLHDPSFVCYDSVLLHYIHCLHFISFSFHIELNNRYNQIRKSVKMGYKGHYNAYMKLTILQCQFDNTFGWLLYM